MAHSRYSKQHRRRPSQRRSKKQRQFIDLNGFFWTIAIVFAVGLVFVLGYDRWQQRQTQEEAAAVSASAASVQKQKQNFIGRVAPEAVQLQSSTHVLPSVTIAQAILESNWGKSSLSQKYNNLFGVKGSDPSNTQELTTQEYVDGKWQTITARFRVYDSYAASIQDHAQLFTRGTTWNPQQYQHFLAAKDYREAAKALETDGYATDPDYASKIIEIVETYQLTKYDQPS